MYTITKEVYFCYGHRLMNHPGKCRNIHGHSVRAAITVASDHLDSQGMVCDFSSIQQTASEFIEKQLDHNFLLHEDDPLCETLKCQDERYLALHDHPTAEVIARMIFEFMKEEGFDIKQVDLWETASARASYHEHS